MKGEGGGKEQMGRETSGNKKSLMLWRWKGRGSSGEGTPLLPASAVYGCLDEEEGRRGVLVDLRAGADGAGGACNFGQALNLARIRKGRGRSTLIAWRAKCEKNLEKYKV